MVCLSPWSQNPGSRALVSCLPPEHVWCVCVECGYQTSSHTHTTHAHHTTQDIHTVIAESWEPNREPSTRGVSIAVTAESWDPSTSVTCERVPMCVRNADTRHSFSDTHYEQTHTQHRHTMHTRARSTDTPHTRAHVAQTCLLYTSPSPRDRQKSRMPSSA